MFKTEILVETNVRSLLFLIAFAASAASAADPELNGTWQISSSHGGRLKFETLLIQQTDGIKISESGAREKTVEFACHVDGHACKLKEGEVSFWRSEERRVEKECR